MLLTKKKCFLSSIMINNPNLKSVCTIIKVLLLSDAVQTWSLLLIFISFVIKIPFLGGIFSSHEIKCD